MSDTVTQAPDEPVKPKKLRLILALVLLLAGASGGFFAVSSGLLFSSEPYDTHTVSPDHPAALPDIAFIEIEPIMISLDGTHRIQHLRFRSQLEVNTAYRDDVEHILPRVIDVMNGYLRALEMKDFEDPIALTRLRSQLLRRIQVVTGKGRVRDLLITEFVLN